MNWNSYQPRSNKTWYRRVLQERYNWFWMFRFSVLLWLARWAFLLMVLRNHLKAVSPQGHALPLTNCTLSWHAALRNKSKESPFTNRLPPWICMTQCNSFSDLTWQNSMVIFRRICLCTRISSNNKKTNAPMQHIACCQHCKERSFEERSCEERRRGEACKAGQDSGRHRRGRVRRNR